MIAYVDARLTQWAEQVGRGGVYLRGQGSMLGKLIDSGGVLIRSTGGAPCMDLQSEEMERCVNKLPTKLRSTVMEFYLSFDSTPLQRAKALGICRRSLYERLDKAHTVIQHDLINARMVKVSQPYPQAACQR